MVYFSEGGPQHLLNYSTEVECSASESYLKTNNDLIMPRKILFIVSSIGGTGYSSFLRRILIKVGRNTLTPMTS